jgi:hypothetical protein
MCQRTSTDARSTAEFPCSAARATQKPRKRGLGALAVIGGGGMGGNKWLERVAGKRYHQYGQVVGTLLLQGLMIRNVSLNR